MEVPVDDASVADEEFSLAEARRSLSRPPDRRARTKMAINRITITAAPLPIKTNRVAWDALSATVPPRGAGRAGEDVGTAGSCAAANGSCRGAMGLGIEPSGARPGFIGARPGFIGAGAAPNGCKPADADGAGGVSGAGGVQAGSTCDAC